MKVPVLLFPDLALTSTPWMLSLANFTHLLRLITDTHFQETPMLASPPAPPEVYSTVALSSV